MRCKARVAWSSAVLRFCLDHDDLQSIQRFLALALDVPASKLIIKIQDLDGDLLTVDNELDLKEAIAGSGEVVNMHINRVEDVLATLNSVNCILKANNDSFEDDVDFLDDIADKERVIRDEEVIVAPEEEEKATTEEEMPHELEDSACSTNERIALHLKKIADALAEGAVDLLSFQAPPAPAVEIQQAERPAKYSTTLFESILCKQCDAIPVGVVYCCTICRNCFLCACCHMYHTEEHPLLKVRSPEWEKCTVVYDLLRAEKEEQQAKLTADINAQAEMAKKEEIERRLARSLRREDVSYAKVVGKSEAPKPKHRRQRASKTSLDPSSQNQQRDREQQKPSHHGVVLASHFDVVPHAESRWICRDQALSTPTVPVAAAPRTIAEVIGAQRRRSTHGKWRNARMGDLGTAPNYWQKMRESAAKAQVEEMGFNSKDYRVLRILRECNFEVNVAIAQLVQL